MLTRANLEPLHLADGKHHVADFTGAMLDRTDFTGTVLEGFDVQPAAVTPETAQQLAS